MRLPARPSALSTTSSPLLIQAFMGMKDQILSEITQKENVHASLREVQEKSKYCIHHYLTGSHGEASKFRAITKDHTSKLVSELRCAPIYLRQQGYITEAIGSYVEVEALHTFFEEGRLVSVTDCVEGIEDEEYICGILGYCQTLSRYAVERAYHTDVESINLCRDLINEIMGQLMLFDFRNGLIRRKYDSLKYSLKGVEDLRYEMSLVPKEVTVTGDGLGDIEMEEKEPVTKKVKVTASLVDGLAFDAMKKRMDDYDAARESVIKLTRDVQKLSKQAIYSLHRNEVSKADFQLKDAITKARHIHETLIKSKPSLRMGSFANAMEEFAEAKLFAHWLSNRAILLPCSEDMQDVTHEEYLGGLVDFTGEVGRFAIACATDRNEEGVKACLSADLQVTDAIMQLTNIPPRLAKKNSALEMNTRKLEHVLYELSLAKATGFNVSKIDKVDVIAAMVEGGENAGEKEL